MKTSPVILPASQWFGTYRQHTLLLSVERLSEILDSVPRSPDDPCKVVNSWRFTVNGRECAVWDYNGSHLRGEFSAYGPADSLRLVFGDAINA